ncbi:MAG: hypothetical protein ACE5LB_13010 [Acidiferrobacterales bacterium]
MKFSPILGQDLSGSVGGLTASRNASGNYFRAKVAQAVPSSERQRTSQEAMRNIGPDWAALGGSSKALWMSYAAAISFTPPIGDPYNITGQQMYVRSKLAVKYANEIFPATPFSVPDDPPSPPVLPTFSTDPTILDATASTQIIRITFASGDAWVSEDGAFTHVRISRPQGLGVTAFTTPFTNLGYIQGNSTSPPSSPFAFSSLAPFQAGQRLFAEFRLYRADGGLSLAVISPGVVTV